MIGSSPVDRSWRAVLTTPVGLWTVLGGVGVGFCLLTIAAFSGRFGWLLELTSHFRVQYLACLGALALGHALGRRWRMAVLFALFVGLNLWVVAPYLLSRPAASDPSGRVLRLVLLNVHTENTRYELVRALLRDTDPDVLILEEVDPRWLVELRDLRTTHPYAVEEPRNDNFGMALFSKHPLRNARTVYLGDAGVPSVVAEDLNVTPCSPRFERLLRETGLTDTARGRGLQGTWPVGLPWMRIPIDHCLISESFRVVNRKVGPAVGSDHFPLLVDVELAR